jgi:hypothetical protein
MSEEKTSHMNINIGKRVRNYLIFFAIIILLQWAEDVTDLIRASLVADEEISKISKMPISSILTAIGSIALIILNFGRDIDLHNFLDNKLFHVREKTGKIIHQHMINAAQSVNAIGYQNMDNMKKDVVYLFYHFANEHKVLRDLAFTYWEQYFVNIYIIVFSSLAFICSLTIMIFQWKIEITSFIPLVFLLIALAVGLRTRYSLIKKIYDLPKQQIAEIRSSKSNEFKSEVQARFA